MEDKYKLWKKYYQIACDNKELLSDNKGILIEVAAQHPLIDGLYPNQEFKSRLDKAIELYHSLNDCKIYVPGSIHYDDKISLSEAGVNYLIEHGIKKEDIYGDECNLKYKAKDGVYNSTDECYVTVQILFDNKYKEIYSVCSSAQLHRKALSYIRFGYIPKMISVSSDLMHHNYIDEIFINIPALINDEEALQGESRLGQEIRNQRKQKQ